MIVWKSVRYLEIFVREWIEWSWGKVLKVLSEVNSIDFTFNRGCLVIYWLIFHQKWSSTKAFISTSRKSSKCVFSPQQHWLTTLRPFEEIKVGKTPPHWLCECVCETTLCKVEWKEITQCVIEKINQERKKTKIIKEIRKLRAGYCRTRPVRIESSCEVCAALFWQLFGNSLLVQ